MNLKKMLMALAVPLAVMPFAVLGLPGADVSADTSGTGWEIKNTTELWITGDSAMVDYSNTTTPWAENKDTIRSVVIESGVTKIGNFAFKELGIKSVSIPDTVTSIGASAFQDCEYLNGTVTIPNSVTTIGKEAFWNCKAMTDITLSSKLEAIPEKAFGNCTALESVEIPSSVKSIGWQAFSNCGKLVVTFNEGLETIEGQAFFINYSAGQSSAPVVGSDGVLTLPNSLKTIGGSVFEGNSSIKKVVFGSSLETIGESAFLSCSNLTVADMTNATSLKTITRKAFQNTALTAITLPDSVTSIGEFAFCSCTKVTSLKLPVNPGFTTIENGVFDGLAITSLEIPANVTTIEDGAFKNNYDLPKIIIPPTVLNLKRNAFSLEWYKDIKTSIDISNPNLNIEAPGSVFNNRYILHVHIPDGHDASTEETYTKISKDASAFTNVGTDGICHEDYCPFRDGDAPCDHVIEKIPAVEATCTETGLTEGQVCMLCKKIIVEQEEVPALGHDYQTVAKVEPTCTKPGVENGEQCSRCGDVKDGTPIPALGHTEVTDLAVAATCTTPGKTAGKHCSVCNEVITAQETVPALGHTEEVIPGKAPTCTETGLTEGKKCSVCDEITETQRVLPALGHTEVTDPAVAPTCTTAGKTSGKHCSVCNAVIIPQTVLDPLGHIFGEDGRCTVCGETAVPDCEHEHVRLMRSEAGHYDICLDCFARLTASAHEWGEYTVITAAGCETGGSRSHSCTVCSYTATEVIPAAGHTTGENWEKDETGHYKICTVCLAQIGDIAAHDWSDYTVISEDDCQNNGERTRSCTVCGYEQRETTPKGEHKYENGVCTVCGAADPGYTPDTPDTPPVVEHYHNYVNGICTVCGKIDPNYVPPTPVIPVPAPSTPTIPSASPVPVFSSTTIAEKILAILDGGSGTISLGSGTKLDKTDMEALAGKDSITVTFKISGDAYWEIRGVDVTDPKAVNLGVKMKGTAIPENTVESFAGGKTTIQMTLSHSGGFGFTGILNVPVGSSNNGKFANLFWYHGGNFEFAGSSEISSGRAKFAMSHASNYLIVVDDYAYGEDVSAAAGAAADEASIAEKRNMYAAFVIIPVFVITAGVYVFRRRASK
ncbi:MAG: leucine-rich repeat domain-containing protein [Eubacterium sp.]|nr:leucine-rich repeat domain-containing protein [Eubacterium sp.]